MSPNFEERLLLGTIPLQFCHPYSVRVKLYFRRILALLYHPQPACAWLILLLQLPVSVLPKAAWWGCHPCLLLQYEGRPGHHES